ncbi:MAG: polyketide synthase dehydratase domain-containing protein [Pirellulaceae bacterium]
MFVSEDSVPTIRVSFDAEMKVFTVHSTVGNDAWDLNSRGRLIEMPADKPHTIDVATIRKSLTDHFDHEAYYADFDAAGYQFGPRFRQITNLWRVDGEVLAEITVPEEIRDTVDQYRIHPAVLDACFHVFKGMKKSVEEGDDPANHFYLPAHVRRIRLYSEHPSGRLWAHTKIVRLSGTLSDLGYLGL